MPLYRIQAPNGLTYQIEGPEGATKEEVAQAVLAKNPDAGKPFKEAGFSLADTGVAALQSAVGATKSTLQGFGAEAPGVETLSNLQKGLGQLYTPERQAEQARRDALEKAAARSGSTLEEIKAGAAGVTEAPIQATASAVGSSVPTIALAMGAAALAVPAAAVLGLGGAAALAFAGAVGIATKYTLGALQGAGSVKGSIYDAVKEEVGKQYPDLSKEEISKIALKAQEFTGKNWDNIMAGTGIGFVAGGTGLEKDLLKKLSKPVAAAAAKEAGEKVGQEVAKKGIIAGTKRAAGAGLKEAVPEAIQGGQEQFAANVAQTREGFETPAMEGVLGAATKEGMMGMLGGSAVSPFTGEATAKPPAPVVDQSGQPTPSELEAQVQQRRLAREQEQMGVKQGRAAREGEKMLDAEAQAEADQQKLARVEAEKAAATELQTLRAQRQAELEQTFPKDYSDVMQKTDAYATLFQEKQALTGQTQTKEVKARIKTIDGLIQGIIEEDNRVPNEFKRMQAENAKVTKNLPPDLQAKYAATAFTIPEPQQMEIRAATVEQTPVQQTDLLGNPIQQEAPAPAAPDKFKTVQTAAEAQAALDLQNRRDARAGQADRNAAKDAGQLGLFTRVGTPTDEAAVAEPKIIVKKPPVTKPTVRVKPTPETVAPVITADTLGVLGIGPTAVMRKPGHAIQGLDITKPEGAADVKNMLTIYKEGRSPAIVQKIDTFLGRPEFQGLPAPAPKVEAAPAPTVAETPVVTPVTLNKGQQKLRDALDANGRIFIDSRDEGGKKTYYAKGVGSTSPDFQVELQLTPEEKKTARLAEADIELASTQEERDAGKKALEDALRPAADRATKPVKAKTTGQSAEKKAANKAAQPSARKAKDETAKSTAEPTSTPTVTKKVEAPATPAPVKVVKKTELKKVEPKKVVKKSEPKKLEAPKVEPKKEEPKVDKALEKARETVDDLDLDPETTKTKVKSFAKRLHKAGLIDDISLNAVESISKDKDMGYEDLLDEIRFALEAYESNQKKAPEAKPELKKVTDESNIIEGETRVIPDNQQKLLEGPVSRLQDDQVEELEDFYGVKKDNPEFWKRLQEDVTLFAEKGAKAVKQAIREIIRQVQAGVLAVGVIFNPGNISAPEAFVLHNPVSVTTTQEVKAGIPASVASKMSDGAKEAYEILIPAMKGKNGDKLMVFVDKPTGRIFIFDADGKPVLDKKVLIGLAKGDLYKGNNDLPQNRITPAGLFGIKIIDAAKGGNAKKTAGDYDFGKVFALEDPDAVVTIMHSVWLKEKDAAQRQAALKSESAADSRYSFGCINIDKATYKYLLDNFQAQMDGAKMFVVPDNQADTKAFLTGEKANADVLVREAVKPVTKTTTQTRDSAFAQEAKTGTLGREQGLPPKEPTRSRITDDQNPVDNPISNAELEGIVDDVKKSLGGEVEVTILDSAKDLDPKAPAGAAGLVKDGNVYLFRDGIKSGIEGAKTVFHELFHLGLQKLLTNPKEYHRVMINLYRMNARVREMADKWIASQEGQDAKAAYAKEYANPNDRLNALTAHGTDEALARIAEELKTGEKIGTGQRAFVRSIAKWLADVAEKIGMRQVAQSIRSATYTEVEKFVQEAMTAAVGAGPVNVRLTRRFAQAAATASDAFKRWFKDSQVVDNNGKPLVVYHGTSRSFDTFLKDMLGAATGAPSAKLGFFFAGDPDTSTGYAINAKKNETESPAESEIRFLNKDIKRYQKGLAEATAQKDPNSIEGKTLRERQEKYRLKQLAEAQAKLKKDPNDRMAKLDVDRFSKQLPESSYVYIAESYIREYTESLARAEKKLTALKAEVRKSAEEIGRRAGENIMPVYLSMQNPLILDQRGAPYRIMSYRDTIIKAKQDGHDGVIIKNTYDGKQQPGWIQRLIAKWRKEDVPSDTIYIAFEPTQIKSAIGNIGTYDPTNPNIRYSIPGGIDENTRRAVQAIQDKTPAKYKEPEKKTLVQQLKSVGEVETRDKAKLLARQKTADKFATVSAKVNQLFSKGYKNAFGDLNPMVLARQAEEACKLVLDFYKAGGIKFGKSGLIETVDTKESLQGAVEQLVDLAAKNDMTYKDAESYVSSLLEGHRLHNMREEHDKPLEASALILEQQGKNKEADAERKKKLARHMDNADIDTLEAAFQKSPEIKAILDTLNATRTQAIDLMVAAGRITKEQGQFWKDNAAYVPFDRVFVESETPIKGRGSYGIATLRNIPGMEGSFERPIKNVFDSYTSRLGWMITEAANNNASYNVLDTMALGGFAKELKPKEVPGNKALTVKVYREGKPVEFEVESVADYEAFQAAPELTGWLVGSLIPAARWVRIGVTAFPAFPIKQVIEDAQRSMFNSGVERPLVTGMKTLYNFPRLLTSDALQALGVSKKMPLVRMMEQLGIIGDYDVNIINPAQDIKIAAGAEKRGWSAKVYHVLEKITKASDLAARLAVFEETLLETGGKRDGDGNITGGDKDLAQLRARELINFSRRGSDPTIRTLSRVVPFMNAYAQGMDVTYRTASGLDSATGSERADARKQFYKMAMKLTALGFMYALAFGDDEGYKNATDEVRDNNFLIPHSDKKIPLPKEIGFLFKSIPERLVNYYRRYGTDEEQSILNLLGTIVKGGVSAYGTPNATPAQLKPILENMTNYSFFLQRELESASMQRLDPSQRFTPSTSELAKSIGALSQQLGNVAGTKIVEVSPIKVDNLLRGLFGIAGSSTLLMTDALINPTRADRPLHQMPFASLFVYDTTGGRAKNEFFDLQEKVSRANNTYLSMKDTNPKKAVEYYAKNEPYILAMPTLNATLKQLTAIRKQRVFYETASPEALNMDGKERRATIDILDKLDIEAVSKIRALDKDLRDLSKANK